MATQLEIRNTSDDGLTSSEYVSSDNDSSDDINDDDQTSAIHGNQFEHTSDVRPRSQPNSDDNNRHVHPSPSLLQYNQPVHARSSLQSQPQYTHSAPSAYFPPNSYDNSFASYDFYPDNPYNQYIADERIKHASKCSKYRGLSLQVITVVILFLMMLTASTSSGTIGFDGNYCNAFRNHQLRSSSDRSGCIECPQNAQYCIHGKAYCSNGQTIDKVNNLCIDGIFALMMNKWWIIQSLMELYRSYEFEIMSLVIFVMLLYVNTIQPKHINGYYGYFDNNYRNHRDWFLHPTFIWVLMSLQGMSLWTLLVPPPWDMTIYQYLQGDVFTILIGISHLILESWYITFILSIIERPHTMCYYLVMYSLLTWGLQGTLEWLGHEMRVHPSHLLGADHLYAIKQLVMLTLF